VIEGASKIRVRLAAKEDALDVWVVRAASWREAYRGILPDAYLAAIKKAWSRGYPDGTWVLEQGGIVVGYCITSCDDLERIAANIELKELYVFPDHWRMGLGTALLEGVLSELKEHGARVASLEVLEPNTRARAFYEHRGFKRVLGAERAVQAGGAAVVALLYRRTL
jgi:ribosomal protein S18 acetylase RimI-like enzyme